MALTERGGSKPEIVMCPDSNTLAEKAVGRLIEIASRAIADPVVALTDDELAGEIHGNHPIGARVRLHLHYAARACLLTQGRRERRDGRVMARRRSEVVVLSPASDDNEASARSARRIAGRG